MAAPNRAGIGCLWPVRATADSNFTDLTIQELQVAVAIAGGITSREVAAGIIPEPSHR